MQPWKRYNDVFVVGSLGDLRTWRRAREQKPEETSEEEGEKSGEGYEAGGPLHGSGQRQASRRAGAEGRGGWDGLALADAVSRTITLVKSRTTTLFPFLLPQAPTCRALHAGSRTFPVARHRVQAGVGGVREPRPPLVVVVCRVVDISLVSMSMAIWWQAWGVKSVCLGRMEDGTRFQHDRAQAQHKIILGDRVHPTFQNQSPLAWRPRGLIFSDLPAN